MLVVFSTPPAAFLLVERVGCATDGPRPWKGRRLVMSQEIPSQSPKRTSDRKVDANAATGDGPSKEPYLPPLHRVGDLIAPKAPQDVASAQVEEGALTDLTVKLAYTVARFTTDW